MRWLAIAAAVLFAVLILFIAAIVVVSETGGEVVVLETLDAEGRPHETRLWLVEHRGHPWLRAGQPGSGWLLRIEEHPEVRLTRDGHTGSYRARPARDPEIRDRIHALMAEKYGWAESVIAASRDGSQSIPVELVPTNDAG